MLAYWVCRAVVVALRAIEELGGDDAMSGLGNKAGSSCRERQLGRARIGTFFSHCSTRNEEVGR